MAPYRVEFSTFAHLDDWDEVEAVTEVTGEILHVARDEKQTAVGTLRGWCVRSARVTETGEGFFEACDKASQELCDIASLVWDTDKDEYREALDLGMPIGNLLVPAAVEISPEHRGKGVGLLTVWRFIDYFGGGAAVTVLKPHPLNAVGAAEKTLKKGVAKLKGHWSRLGFRPIPNSCSVGNLTASDYSFLDMSMMRPSLEDLLVKERS